MEVVYWLPGLYHHLEGIIMSKFEEKMKRNSVRYAAISHLANKFEWTSRYNYAQFAFTATTTDPEARSLSAADVALLADGGNLCFGGRGFSKCEAGDKTIFSGIVHTD